MAKVENIDLRMNIVDLVRRGNGGHIPSAFSIVDIIDTVYSDFLKHDSENPDWEGRDIFILSKGHGCAALYVVLHKNGYLQQKDMDEYLSFQGILGGHPDRTKVPGAEASTGSLGHGLPFAVGIALGLKVQKKSNRVIVLVGDGECHEGTIWESALVAQSLGLDNLCCFIDYNGSADQILPHPNIAKQWEAFGWGIHEIDGHNPDEIRNELGDFYKRSEGVPTAIIANTVKGKGVSFLQKHGPWHYKVPDDKEYEAIKEELQS
jgi:transketolase